MPTAIRRSDMLSSGAVNEWRGQKVALSGDTTYSEALAGAAQGADLLVQNVIAFSERLSGVPEMQGVLAKLTMPEQAAKWLRPPGRS